MVCRSWSAPVIIWTSEIPELEARRSESPSLLQNFRVSVCLVIAHVIQHPKFLFRLSWINPPLASISR